jgi:3-phenylpropionate/cinnamic acid dioxygenase small subunit
VKPLQEISDRLEIEELLVRWSEVIDARDWAAYPGLFTEDATLDFSDVGSRGHDPRTHVEFLTTVMPHIARTQHLDTNITITMVDADTARARTACFSPGVLRSTEQVVFTGVWYHDVLKRTPDGWRIQSRVVEKTYMHNFPDDFEVPSQPSESE